MTMLPRSHRSRFGATLAESIVAMCVSALFLSLLPGFYLTGIKVWQREGSKLTASGRADFALERMKEDVRTARSAVVSSDGQSLALVLPMRAFDSELGCEANVIDEQGMLQDGDVVQYFLLQDSSSVGSGRTLHRRVVAPGGTVRKSTLLAEHVHPELNPLNSSTGIAQPVFHYDETTQVLTVNIAVAEPNASKGTFAPSETDVECRRDGGTLVRVATQDEPEGVVQCNTCGAEVKSNAQIAAYNTRLLLRNG
jgi:hypothetical protein